LRPKMMEKRAFMSGSSKQGKATRASAGSMSDVAINLSHKNLFSIYLFLCVNGFYSTITVLIIFRFLKMVLLSDTVFDVGRAVESNQLIVEDGCESHGDFVAITRFQTVGCFNNDFLESRLQVFKTDYSQRTVGI
jgi:hypothetical protein